MGVMGEMAHAIAEGMVERETGFEPATPCLEGRHSTTELLPLAIRIAQSGSEKVVRLRGYGGGVEGLGWAGCATIAARRRVGGVIL